MKTLLPLIALAALGCSVAPRRRPPTTRTSTPSSTSSTASRARQPGADRRGRGWSGSPDPPLDATTTPTAMGSALRTTTAQKTPARPRTPILMAGATPVTPAPTTPRRTLTKTICRSEDNCQRPTRCKKTATVTVWATPAMHARRAPQTIATDGVAMTPTTAPNGAARTSDRTKIMSAMPASSPRTATVTACRTLDNCPEIANVAVSAGDDAAENALELGDDARNGVLDLGFEFLLLGLKRAVRVPPTASSRFRQGAISAWSRRSLPSEEAAQLAIFGFGPIST